MVPPLRPVSRWRSDRGKVVGTIEEIASYLDKSVEEVKYVIDRGIEVRGAEYRGGNIFALDTSQIFQIIGITNGVDHDNGHISE
jgi:hypothetical protein